MDILTQFVPFPDEKHISSKLNPLIPRTTNTGCGWTLEPSSHSAVGRASSVRCTRVTRMKGSTAPETATRGASPSPSESRRRQQG